LAEKLLNEHKNNIDALEMIPASGGVFEIFVDSKCIFSKQDLNRFPEEDEVEAKIRQL